MTDTPSPVKNLIVKSVNAVSALLEWEPVDNNGGSDVFNYVVEKKESDMKTWSNVSTLCEALSFRVPKLLEGKEYYFRVMAENKFGTGAAVCTVKPAKARQPVGEFIGAALIYWSYCSGLISS